MSLSSFSNVAVAENAVPVLIPMPNELVRGADSDFVAQILPRVQQESVALDLSQVERIDAAGIAALITLYCSAVEAGTDFSVVSPSTHVLELLRIVGLEAILVAELRSGTSVAACRCRSAA